MYTDQSFTTIVRNLIGADEEATETIPFWTELQSVSILHAEFRLGPVESNISRHILNMIHIHLWTGYNIIASRQQDE